MLGAVQGASVVPLYLIARSMLRVVQRRLGAALLALFCMSGSLTVGLAGTTYYDNVLSLLVLGGLAFVVAMLALRVVTFAELRQTKQLVFGMLDSKLRRSR